MPFADGIHAHHAQRCVVTIDLMEIHDLCRLAVQERAFEADPAAMSHRDRLVIKRVRQVVEAAIDARWSRVEIGRSYFGGSTLIVAVGPTPAVRIHIGSFPDPS